jgi:hypothetical protein
VKQIRKRITYANVMSSIAVFLVLGGGAAYAAKKIGTNEIKGNSITTGKLKKNAVTSSKIKKNAITTAKIKNGAVTGPKINLGTLGTVPSANTANVANSLAGQTPFYIRLGFGQSQTIASNGSVSLVVNCRQAGGQDIVEILEQTTQAGAVANGEDDFDGSSAADFLNPETLPEDRVFLDESVTSGSTIVYYEYDQGWVIGPDNKMLTANSEGIALGLNYRQPGCLVGGVVNAVG